MTPDFERRAFAECRVESTDGRTLTGYAIVFHTPSVDLGGFIEDIDPSAVDRTLTEVSDVRALVDHDSAKVIGRTRSGTLQLRKDSTGLRFTVEPDQGISYAADIMRAVRRGDVSGMSFGFRVLGESWNFEEKTPRRTVTDMKVSEISVVTFPAYPDTSVAMRSLQQYRQEARGMALDFARKVQMTEQAR